MAAGRGPVTKYHSGLGGQPGTSRMPSHRSSRQGLGQPSLVERDERGTSAPVVAADDDSDQDRPGLTVGALADDEDASAGVAGDWLVGRTPFQPSGVGVVPRA